MAATYQRSRVVFNASINGDLNMRFFEAMGAGALLVTDRIGNGQEDLFIEGQHYAGYTDERSAIDTIRYYLTHEDERRAIANKARDLVLKEHRYEDRFRLVKDAVGTLGQARPAPVRHLARAQVRRLTAEVYEGFARPGPALALLAENPTDPRLAVTAMRAALRWANRRVPLTPGAIRAWWRRR
jgi:hypothetical protein